MCRPANRGYNCGQEVEMGETGKRAVAVLSGQVTAGFLAVMLLLALLACSDSEKTLGPADGQPTKSVIVKADPPLPSPNDSQESLSGRSGRRWAGEPGKGQIDPGPSSSRTERAPGRPRTKEQEPDNGGSTGEPARTEETPPSPDAGDELAGDPIDVLAEGSSNGALGTEPAISDSDSAGLDSRTGPDPDSKGNLGAAAEPVPLADGWLLPDFAALYEKVLPRVVVIRATNEGGPGKALNRGVESMGTGFFFGPAGEVLTNAHVVSGFMHIEIETSEGKRYPATLVGADPLTDVALVRAQVENSTEPLQAAAPGSVVPGMWVMAVGSPFGLGFSATKGIVSAVNRTDVLWDSVGYQDFIQTDAPINRGNSGGPLVNQEGSVIGICTLIEAQANRIAFAVPMTTAVEVARHLREYGELRRAFLGVLLEEREEGLEVVGVGPDTPAFRANLRPGDRIVAMDGQPVEGLQPFRWRVAIRDTETPVTLTVRRANAETEVVVHLEAARDPGPAR